MKKFFLFPFFTCLFFYESVLSMECIFCDIVNGKSPAYKIWEDEKHLAFLSIFPNTPGVTVVIPKMHYSSYAFSLPDTVLSSLILASKKVALILDKNLEDVGRTGLVFEGFGIDHIHAKLFPLHGTKTLEEWHPIKSSIKKYFSTYEGYISSHDGERASEEELKKICDELTKNKQG